MMADWQAAEILRSALQKALGHIQAAFREDRNLSEDLREHVAGNHVVVKDIKAALAQTAATVGRGKHKEASK